MSVDASHYRTLSTTAGNIAAAAALAVHSDTHPEHRRPRKHADVSVGEHSVTSHPSEGPQDEVNDAVLSALSESFYSEGGRRKRVSWSQERQEPTGASSRRSPVISAALRHTPAAAAALLARGRPSRRAEEEEAENLPEEPVETERRNASRASRRSAGMVLLGVGVLFGIGRYAGGTQPLVGGGVKTGAVLAPTSNMDISLATGSPVVEIPHNYLTNPLPFSLDVELLSFPNDTEFTQLRQPDDNTNQLIIGRIFAWLCTTLYLTSRLPQIWKNVSYACAAKLLAIILTMPIVR